MDLPAAASVLRKVHERDGYPRRWYDPAEDWLVTDDTVGAWVAVEDGAVVGHVLLEAADDGLHVGRLFTDPDRRGNGAADLLLDTVVAAAAERGLPLSLEVDVHGVRAVGFYEKRGWTRIATGEPHWFEPDGSRGQRHVYVAPR